MTSENHRKGGSDGPPLGAGPPFRTVLPRPSHLTASKELSTQLQSGSDSVQLGWLQRSQSHPWSPKNAEGGSNR